MGLLALQNLAWKEVEPYPLDVLVAESRDDWLYAGAELERTAADAACHDGADAH
ncbi:hypothetical protein ECZU25_10100 [Escherichia coli]|nr:hypothetical protein ECZU25_10100 [Escherichia coli]